MGWLKKVAKSIKKAVKNPVKSFKGLAEKSLKIAFDPLKIAEKGLSALKPDAPKVPDAVSAAAPAPDPEDTVLAQGTPENISRRKRSRRNGLRIDLNTGGAPAGNGVNMPVG
jgi:hypothetical protein